MNAYNFISKYSKSSNKSIKNISFDKIPATKKWVEYSLDLLTMNSLLISTKDFNQKMDLLASIEVVERKRNWMLKHPNFDLKSASIVLNSVKNSPSIK